jgi:hypothetical protein
MAVLKNMFKFGYGFSVIRRNNAMPFAYLYFGAAYPHPLIPNSPNGYKATKPFIASACTISL